MPIIPATHEAEIRGIRIQGQPRQKVETPSQPIKLGTCAPSYSGGINKRIKVEANLSKNSTHYLKNKAKRAEGMALSDRGPGHEFKLQYSKIKFKSMHAGHALFKEARNRE
jgi:hypothetical protein